MKKRPTGPSLLHKLCAGLLFFIFISIPFVQIAHHHTESTSFGHGYKHKSAISSKCLTCEYLVHKQSEQHGSDATFTLSIFSVQIPTVKGPISCSVYTAAVQAFTNKGPPVIS